MLEVGGEDGWIGCVNISKMGKSFFVHITKISTHLNLKYAFQKRNNE